MALFKTGLHPLDQSKHARFKTALDYGFTFPTPTYPIDKTGGLTELGIDGNGPDQTVTLVSADPNTDLKQGSGCCGVAEAPAHIDMVAAALNGEPVGMNTLTSDQTLTIYYLYQSDLAGAGWAPGDPVPAGLDQGVDLGDLLLWLFHNNDRLTNMGLSGIEGFLKLNLDQVDAALDLFGTVTAGWALPDMDAFENCFMNGVTADTSNCGQPNPEEGHCMGIASVGTAKGLSTLRTWGGLITISGELRAGMLQQAFAVLTHEQATSIEFPFTPLVQDLKDLGGTA